VTRVTAVTHQPVAPPATHGTGAEDVGNAGQGERSTDSADLERRPARTPASSVACCTVAACRTDGYGSRSEFALPRGTTASRPLIMS
jgi:hypothetical protein